MIPFFKPSFLKVGLFKQIVNRSKTLFLWSPIVILCLSYYRNVAIRAKDLTRWISHMTKLVAMSSRPKPTFWNTVSTLLLSAKWVPPYPMVSASVVCISEYTFVMEINKWCEIYFLIKFLIETILILFPQASMRILTGYWPLPPYSCPSFCPSASSCYATVLESKFFPELI